MNGKVLGIFVSAGGLKCLVVIADWLVCVADISGDLDLMTMCFWQSNFHGCFSFLFSCIIAFHTMVRNLQTHKYQALHHSHLSDDGRSIS